MRRGFSFCLLVLVYMSLTSLTHGQMVGYLYPAGGQQGTTFEMLMGGAGIGGGQRVFVTGGGVDFKILERPRYGNFLHQDPYGGKCVGVYNAMLDEEARLMALRYDPDPTKLEKARASLRLNREKRRMATPIKSDEIPTPTDEEVYKSSVYWHKLRNPTLADLQLLYYEYGGIISTDQKNHSSYGSTLIVEVTIAPDAKPGLRELYVVTSGGLSRAVRFWVSDIHEVNEIEPNEGPIWPGFKNRFKAYEELPPQELPVVINAQIKPGDIDRFWFKGKKDQQLVFDIQSRSTAPYIANAVPGWFVAVMTLYDKEGKRLAYAESFRFDQNPLMYYKLPEDGQYMIEVQDSIFRGRNDFVYRLSIGELPLVYAHFPLGGKVNEPTAINLLGGNLPTRSVTPDFSGDVSYDEIRQIDNIDGKPLVRPLKYMVETLPIFLQPAQSESAESYASNDSEEKPKPNVTNPPVKIPFPTVIYGRIDKIGQIGTYTFEGKANQKIAIDVTAQPLGSAMDAAIELLDPTGKQIAANDDRADNKGPNIGYEVMHSDPTLMVTLPRNGIYTARVYNVTRRAGPEYFYRMRISEPQPCFDVCAIPSRLRFNGKTASFKVKVFRKEGFDGVIQLKPTGASAQMKISKDGKINPGEEEATFTIVTEQKLPSQPMPVEILATAEINGKTIKKKIFPTDDWEQAFIWHHLVPAQDFMATQR